MSGKIFISYRRGDDPGNTGRLFDQLEDVFPRERLTVVDSIPPGLDTARVLEEQVAQCDVLLAVISKGSSCGSWRPARGCGPSRAIKHGPRGRALSQRRTALSASEDTTLKLWDLAGRNAE